MKLDYTNILKVLNNYGQDGVTQLITIVGVKTGRLKSSISYDVVNGSKQSLKFSWLSYGQYINPWVKKTGWKTDPGYKKVINKNFYSSLSTSLEKQISKDITIDLIEDIKKINNK